jgi:hypothetical protein
MPPVEHQFKPGQSGNPAGRPKSRTMTERLRAALEEEGRCGGDMGDTVIQIWLSMILDGHLGALTELMARVDGPVVNSHKLEHGGAIQIKVEYADPDSHASEAAPVPAEDP